jgi:hypothetical protein
MSAERIALKVEATEVSKASECPFKNKRNREVMGDSISVNAFTQQLGDKECL